MLKSVKEILFSHKVAGGCFSCSLVGWDRRYIYNFNSKYLHFIISNNSKATMISPLTILRHPYSVILLNQNGDTDNREQFTRIWNQAAVRVSVDGGTNTWYLMHKKDANLKLPDYVTGDFDSIKPDVLSYVQNLGENVKVVSTPDQDDTDFTKAFQIISGLNSNESQTQPFPKTILTLTSNKTGRFDQQVANLNTLIKSLSTDSQLYLFDHQNLVFPLAPTSTKCDSNTKTDICLQTNLTCGVIPLNGETIVKTTGLKWDLDGSYGFGGIVSTSNETVKDVISIEMNRPLIFTLSWTSFP